MINLKPIDQLADCNPENNLYNAVFNAKGSVFAYSGSDTMNFKGEVYILDMGTYSKVIDSSIFKYPPITLTSITGNYLSTVFDYSAIKLKVEAFPTAKLTVSTSPSVPPLPALNGVNTVIFTNANSLTTALDMKFLCTAAGGLKNLVLTVAGSATNIYSSLASTANVYTDAAIQFKLSSNSATFKAASATVGNILNIFYYGPTTPTTASSTVLNDNIITNGYSTLNIDIGPNTSATTAFTITEDTTTQLTKFTLKGTGTISASTAPLVPASTTLTTIDLSGLTTAGWTSGTLPVLAAGAMLSLPKGANTITVDPSQATKAATIVGNTGVDTITISYASAQTAALSLNLGGTSGGADTIRYENTAVTTLATGLVKITGFTFATSGGDILILDNDNLVGLGVALTGTGVTGASITGITGLISVATIANSIAVTNLNNIYVLKVTDTATGRYAAIKAAAEAFTLGTITNSAATLLPGNVLVAYLDDRATTICSGGSLHIGALKYNGIASTTTGANVPSGFTDIIEFSDVCTIPADGAFIASITLG